VLAAGVEARVALTSRSCNEYGADQARRDGSEHLDELVATAAASLDDTQGCPISCLGPWTPRVPSTAASTIPAATF
jgi:hypothetical protein